MSDWEVLLESRRFQVVRQAYTSADGKRHVRETVQHPGAVTILPWLEGDRVCLIRNFRVAVGQTLVELPAGTLEGDEDPAETARRELLEETGYRAQEIKPLCQFYMSPGILDERMHLFLGTGLEAGPQELESGEQIETLVVAWDEAMRMAANGEIQDAKTLVGLFYFDRILRNA